MTDHNIQSHCCNHYPNRVLQKKDLADELSVCEKTVTNLLKAGLLPEPCWLNSIPVWMLYDIHAFLSGATGPRTGVAQTAAAGVKASNVDKRSAKGNGHKAGKYSA